MQRNIKLVILGVGVICFIAFLVKTLAFSGHAFHAPEPLTDAYAALYGAILVGGAILLAVRSASTSRALGVMLIGESLLALSRWPPLAGAATALFWSSMFALALAATLLGMLVWQRRGRTRF